MTTNTININADRALQLLEEVVKERGGNFVYKAAPDNLSCTYVRDGHPDCGVGQALANSGVSLATLAKLDEGSPWGAPAFMLQETFQEVDTDVNLTDEAALVFDAFQTSQDDGEKWSIALRKARQEHRNLTKTATR